MQIKEILTEKASVLPFKTSKPQSNSDLPSVQQSPQQRQVAENEYSIYDDEPAKKEQIIQSLKKLAIAFPAMNEEFYLLLAETIADNKMSAQRLKDAVKYVINDFKFKELNISDIVKFDKSVKHYTGAEFMNMQMQGYHFSEFETRKINNETFFVLKSDLAKF